MSYERDIGLEVKDEEFHSEDENSEIFCCKYCDFQTLNIDDLDEHIIDHDEALMEDEIEDVQLVKEEENDIFEDFQLQDLSETRKKRRKRSTPPAFFDETTTERMVFVCPFCAYQSMHKKDMNKHLLSHNKPVEVPIYACSECQYTTRRKCDMPKHLLTHCKDGNIPMYKCPHCPYATKRKNDLPKHIMCHNSPENTLIFSCKHCTYTTKRKGDLRKHMASHENDLNGQRESSRYNCTECGYSSRRLNDLHKHAVLHCDRDVKGIFKCPKCDYASQVGSMFARHILSNCSNTNATLHVLPKDPDNMQDYIVLEEEDLQLIVGGEKNRKRRLINEYSELESETAELENYYIKNEFVEPVLGEEEQNTTEEKVVVLAGFENTE